MREFGHPPVKGERDQFCALIIIGNQPVEQSAMEVSIPKHWAMWRLPERLEIEGALSLGQLPP